MERSDQEPLTRDVTSLLERLSGGDDGASDELLELLYRDLYAAAKGCMSEERVGHTLQPTALVHEAYLRLADSPVPLRFEGRRHFLRVASRAMRRVLVDHARARRAQKRGQAGKALPIDALLAEFEQDGHDVLEVHDTLKKLAAVDPQLARVVELRFFGGLTIEETAVALDSSDATIVRSWRAARAWMRRELG